MYSNFDEVAVSVLWVMYRGLGVINTELCSVLTVTGSNYGK